jgi:hypothetical protein
MILRTIASKPDLPFQSWRRDVYSQCGEDGVIEKLLDQIDCRTGYFVEFGAWDGRHLSNTAKLAEEGWSGCFIEGEPGRFRQLRQTYAANSKITCVNAFVRTHGASSLDRILEAAAAPEVVDLLSIDIDGNDYHVWRGFTGRTARLVVIEFNQSIPAHVVYVQDDDPTINRGASLTAMTELAFEKGYELVAATDWNAFYVQSELARRRGLRAYTPSQVKNPEHEAAIFHGFDGTIIVAGNRQLIWHGLEYGADELQIMPEQLRKIPVGQSESYYARFAAFKNRRSGF